MPPNSETTSGSPAPSTASSGYLGENDRQALVVYRKRNRTPSTKAKSTHMLNWTEFPDQQSHETPRKRRQLGR